MVGLKIIIKEKEDTTPPLSTDVDYASLETFIILEKGMQSGATSVAFHFKDKLGNEYITETSAKILEAMTGALKGAEQRFKEKTDPNQSTIFDDLNKKTDYERDKDGA